jgi:hypothetical protein
MWTWWTHLNVNEEAFLVRNSMIKGVVEFILSLCLLTVSAFRPVYHGGKAGELTGYRANKGCNRAFF